MTEQTDITVLLRRVREGNQEAENELYNAVFPHLLEMARGFMRREPDGHTLQSRDLVNELYLRLHFVKDLDWQNRKHFFAIAARSMQRFLIDYHRKWHKAPKSPLPAEELLPIPEWDIDQAIAIAELLEQLKAEEPLWCAIAEMKCFLGLSDKEVAAALDLKLKTMQRKWHYARKWLFEHLKN